MKLKIYLQILGILALVSCKDLQKETNTQAKSSELQTELVELASYQDLKGNPIEIEDYKGKKVLLNYWATWCRPCIEEMPDLLKLQELLKSENYVFLLASDESIKKIEDFKRDRQFDFNFIKYNGNYAELGINALPVSFIYDKAGEQVLRFDGAMEWTTPELIEQLKNLD